MDSTGWIQLIILIVLVGATIPVLGTYMAKVYSGDAAPGDRVFGPIERVFYKAARVDDKREQRWTTYALSVLAFSLMCGLVLYAIQRFQGSLPLNPDAQKAVPPDLSFNTATSFLTNTNWQAYSGESTMSHLTQMMGLAVQNFVSAAVGISVAIAFVRGLTRRKSATIGNFWVDLTRTVVRLLLPISFVFALVFVSQGAIQNFHAGETVTTVEGSAQVIPQGPVASQESIKELGTNGGGFFNANSAHPYESPNPLTNMLQMWLLLAIPFSLTFTFGKMAKDQKQGWVVFTAMFLLWFVGALVAMGLETRGNPNLTTAGASQQVTATNPGGNMEGKEVRFGPEVSGIYADSVTGTGTGSVDSMHESFTPIGGAVPLVNMMFSEVSPGGVGGGLYGMLMFAILSVFIAGLMVGRTPEYLGKKIQGPEMKLVVMYILFVPVVVLVFTAISLALSSTVASLANPGPHGLTEMTYAFTSAANNNGSAFAGLSANTSWFNTTLGICTLVGRFLLMVPMLAVAGSLARKQKVPASAGTFPTNTPLFAGLLTAIVVIVVGLTYFPVLALGPIVEHLSGTF